MIRLPQPPRFKERGLQEHLLRIQNEIEQADTKNWKKNADQTFNFQLYLTSIETGITASTTQSQGEQPLTKMINVVETVANANDVVTLPPASEGRIIFIRNDDTRALQIYPASGDAIDGGVVDTSISEPATSGLVLIAVDDANWYTLAAT